MVKLLTYGGLGALTYALAVGDLAGTDLMVAFYWAAEQVTFALHLGEAVIGSWQ